MKHLLFKDMILELTFFFIASSLLFSVTISANFAFCINAENLGKKLFRFFFRYYWLMLILGVKKEQGKKLRSCTPLGTSLQLFRIIVYFSLVLVNYRKTGFIDIQYAFLFSEQKLYI